MTTFQTRGCGPDDRTGTSTSTTDAPPSMTAVPVQGTGLRRKAVACGLLALIPVSVLAGFLVLLAMSGSAASATGGCGGG